MSANPTSGRHATPHPRADTIAGLRALAMLMEEHPEWDFKLAGDLWAGVHVADVDEFIAAGQALRHGYHLKRVGGAVVVVNRPGAHICIELETDEGPYLARHEELMESWPAYRVAYEARRAEAVET